MLPPENVSRRHGEMALWALEKAPFCAIFGLAFVDFPRVFDCRFLGLPQKWRLMVTVSPEQSGLAVFPSRKELGHEALPLLDPRLDGRNRTGYHPPGTE